MSTRPGAKERRGLLSRYGRPSLIMLPQAAVSAGKADAQEAEAGLCQDDCAELHGHEHDEGLDAVRQHVGEEDAAVACARGAQGKDVVVLLRL